MGPNQINRRAFLSALACAGLGTSAFLHQDQLRRLLSLPRKKNSRIRGGFYTRPPGFTDTYYDALKIAGKTAFEWNLLSDESRIHSVSTGVHAVETHPYDINLSVLATKQMNSISTFDWKLGREIARHTLPSSAYFYGHAVFNDDGSSILATIVSPDANGIAVFSVPNLTMIDFISTARSAHEVLHLGQDQFVMGLTSSGEHPCAFGLLDLYAKKLTVLPTHEGVLHHDTALPHLKRCGKYILANVQQNGYFKNQTRMSTGLISLDLETKEIKTLIEPGTSDVQEFLSFAYDSQNRNIWVTAPRDQKVYVWSLNEDRLLKTISFSQNTKVFSAIYVEDRELMVIGTQDHFFAFNTNTLERSEASELRWPHRLLETGYSAHTRQA